MQILFAMNGPHSNFCHGCKKPPGNEATRKVDGLTRHLQRLFIDNPQTLPPLYRILEGTKKKSWKRYPSDPIFRIKVISTKVILMRLQYCKYLQSFKCCTWDWKKYDDAWEHGTKGWSVLIKIAANCWLSQKNGGSRTMQVIHGKIANKRIPVTEEIWESLSELRNRVKRMIFSCRKWLH